MFRTTVFYNHITDNSVMNRTTISYIIRNIVPPLDMRDPINVNQKN